MMTAKEASALFDHQVVARLIDGKTVEGNNRGMASRDGVSLLAIETGGGFEFIPLAQLAGVEAL